MLFTLHEDKFNNEGNLFSGLHSESEKKAVASKLRTIVEDAYAFFNKTLEQGIPADLLLENNNNQNSVYISKKLTQEKVYLELVIKKENGLLNKHQRQAKNSDIKMNVANEKLQELKELRSETLNERQEKKKECEEKQKIKENNAILEEKLAEHERKRAKRKAKKEATQLELYPKPFFSSEASSKEIKKEITMEKHSEEETKKEERIEEYVSNVLSNSM